MYKYLGEWWLSGIGSLASILGLVISVFLLLAFFSIKKQFMFRSRVEEHAKNLASLSSTVSNCLNSYSDDDHDILEAFALANVELRCIQRGASGNLLDDVKNARRAIRIYQLRVFLSINRLDPTENTVRNVNLKLNIVIEELSNVKKELMVG